MATKNKDKKERGIVSAISLWKQYDLGTPLGASEWGVEEKDGKYFELWNAQAQYYI